jgi:ribosomal protein S18 acetylase RimI-like enzyme
VNLQFRAFDDQDLADIVHLSLLAWEPIFRSFEHILGLELYTTMYPDWRKSQQEGVETVCRGKAKVLVAETDGHVVGFVAYEVREQDERGEVLLLAVHPEYQRLGIGTELNVMALQKMQEAGVKMAVVETGGDSAHAPARRSYEKAGYTALPIVRYFKDLQAGTQERES